MKKLTPEFVFAKDMPINARIRLILIIGAIGFGLQLFLSPIIGWIMVFCAAMIAAMKGRSNAPEIMSEGDWQSVSLGELEKTQKLLQETSQYKFGRSTALNGIGCVIVIAGIFAAVVLFSFMDGGSAERWFSPVMAGGPVSLPLAADIFAFMVVLGLSGGASAWEPPNLRTRIDQLSGILSTAQSNQHLEFQPSLQLAKTEDGMVPMDCKLLVRMKDTDPSFIGIQVQVSFNEVRGAKLPYTYCVLLAKPEFQLAKKTGMIEMPPPGGFAVGLLGLFADANQKREAQFARFSGSLIELKQESDVDIVVVRQDTSEGAGYTTSPDQALEVFSDAYVLAQSMLKA